MVKVLIAGGGTAGHVNPGLSIAKYLQDNMKNVEILFVGTKKGLETRLVPREGFRLELVRVQGFRRKFSLDTIKSIRDVFFGILDAVRLIKKTLTKLPRDSCCCGIWLSRTLRQSPTVTPMTQ